MSARVLRPSTSTCERCILEPAIVCEVINQATANIRRALVEHAECLRRYQIRWALQSPTSLIESIDETFCLARGANSSRPEWQLLTSVQLLLHQQFLKTNLDRSKLPSEDRFIKVTLAGTSDGYVIKLAEEHQLIGVPEVPYLIEGLNQPLKGGFLTFREAFNAGRDFHRESVRLLAHLETGIHKRQELLAAADELTSHVWELELARYEIIRDAILDFQTTMARIAHSLQVVALAIDTLQPSSEELQVVLTKLRRSVGFQSIGARLLELFAEKFRGGKYTVTRNEILGMPGITQNALESGIAAMIAQELIVQAWWGHDRELWLTPILCRLATVAKNCEPGKVEPQPAADVALNHQTEFRNLLLFAEKQLTPLQQKGLKYIVERGGKVSLDDLALRMGWDSPIKNSWDGMMQRVNTAIQQYNSKKTVRHKGVANVSLMLRRRSSCAELTPISPTSSGRMQASSTSKTRRKGSTK